MGVYSMPRPCSRSSATLLGEVEQDRGCLYSLSNGAHKERWLGSMAWMEFLLVPLRAGCPRVSRIDCGKFYKRWHYTWATV